MPLPKNPALTFYNERRAGFYPKNMFSVVCYCGSLICTGALILTALCGTALF